MIEYFLKALQGIIVFSIAYMMILFGVALYQVYTNPDIVIEQLNTHAKHRMNENVER